MAIIYALGDGAAYSTLDQSVLVIEAADGFIIDRTAEDVARWKELHDKGWAAMTPDEQLEWALGMKGAYKPSDMNRVESAVVELAARFAERGTVLTLTTKTDWTRTGWPTKSDMRRYFGNVEALRQATGVTLNAPATPTVNNRLTYQRANDLEKILLAVKRWLDSTDESEYYSGELYAGEV
jgi:hypothetical protein